MELIDALKEFGIPYKDSQIAEGEIWICCPFCEEEGETPDTKFRLGVNVQTGKMNCFNCNKRSSDPEYISQELERALELGTLAAAGKQGKKKIWKETGPIELPADFIRIESKPLGDYWGMKAWKFLRSRGVTTKQMRRNKIGYSEAGRYSYRVIFPVYYKKKLRCFVGRDFTGRARIKNKNSVGRKYLYVCRPFRRDCIVLSEGALDALAIARGTAGFSLSGKGIGSAAVLGHVVTDEQLKQLKKLKPKKVIIWFDPDKAGLDGIERVWAQLKEIKIKNVFAVTFEAGDRDPDEYSKAERRKKIKDARPVTQALIDKLRGRLVLGEE